MQTQQAPAREATVMKAFTNACKSLRVSEEMASKVVGTTRPTLRRRTRGFDHGSKQEELQLLFIRLYRSLYALMGGDENAMRHWFNAPNKHLHGTPKALCTSVMGLANINLYLDAMRGKA